MNDSTPPAAAALEAESLARLQRELDPDGSYGIVGRILRTYEGSLQTMIGRLGAAQARGDAHELGEVAHKMRSSSASVGALALAAHCTQVERALRDGDAVDVAGECAALLALADAALAAVRAMLASQGTPR